jgi:hypothetical protein
MPSKKKPSEAPALETRAAKHGQRMLEVRVRFWTDDIAKKKGDVIPKHAWGSGMINIDRNEAHGLIPEKWLAFNSMAEIASVIEKCLLENDVKIISSRKMKKYALAEPPKTSEA